MTHIEDIHPYEYFYETLGSVMPQLELLPFFKIVYTRLIDPQIVSIRLVKSGLIVNRIKNIVPSSLLVKDNGVNLTVETNEHFFYGEYSSKDLYDNFVLSKESLNYNDILYAVSDIDTAYFKEYNIFGEFNLAYQLFSDRNSLKNLEKELADKCNQLTSAVKKTIDISYYYRKKLIEECAQNSYEKITSEIKNFEEKFKIYFMNSYEEEYNSNLVKTLEQEVTYYCQQAFDSINRTDELALVYSFCDMDRVDCGQWESNYTYYISRQYRSEQEQEVLQSIIKSFESKMKDFLKFRSFSGY